MDPSDPVYCHIDQHCALPNLQLAIPFLCVVISEVSLPEIRMYKIAEWAVSNGCRTMSAWGKNCSQWDDMFDWANINLFPDWGLNHENHVMTTWHNNEGLPEVFEFAKFLANGTDAWRPEQSLLLHISEIENKDALSRQFMRA